MNPNFVWEFISNNEENAVIRPSNVRLSALVAPLIVLGACQPPPPAPEGLDASASYMVREFYSDDATFQAGVQGFMNWFEDEGFELLDLENTAENVSDAFTVGRLSESDIEHLPITGGRSIADAAGVVSLAEMSCSVTEAEDWLLRKDQDALFDDWDGYERTFVNSRESYEGATRSEDFVAIDAELLPFEEGFDAEPWASTLLQTENLIDPSPILGGLADLDDYEMHLDFRHGVFEIDGEMLQAFSIITFIEEGATGPAGNNHLHQSYSIEINVDRGNNTTLRMLAVWAEPEGGGLDPDDPIILNYAVNKSRGASERMTELCEGTLEVGPEP